MKRKGKGSGSAKRSIITVIAAMPILTIALSLLCAKLILAGTFKEEQVPLLCGAIAAIVSFLLCLYTSAKAPQKKLLWGMLTATGYACTLLLGNLLFFGVGYGSFVGVLLPIFAAGLAASLLGAVKRRKFA